MLKEVQKDQRWGTQKLPILFYQFKIVYITVTIKIVNWLVRPKELRWHGYIQNNTYYFYVSGSFDYWQ